MKVAIVHDWLVGGGAELVVQELHRLYPDAPIYTSYATDEWRRKLDGKVVTGYLQKWPFSRLRKYLPILRIRWFTGLDFSGYDLVISSSGNGEAKGIKVPSGTKHICYCHTPTHFYWRHHDYYEKHSGFGPLGSLGLKLLTRPLRSWDKNAAQRPDHYIANSTHIQHDIKKYYGRESEVIHPPVNIERFAVARQHQANTSRRGFITVGRQVPYKRVDIIVEACIKLGLPLTVIGRGPEHDKLKKLAGENVVFMERASDDEVSRCLASSEAFILAAFEDFGITPVEALACGTPVIAYKKGGALDYVIEGKTGEFFDNQTADSLGKVLESFNSSKYSADDIAKTAEAFSEEQFQKKISAFIKEALKQ